MELSNDQIRLSEWQEYLVASEHSVEIAKEAVAYYTAKMAMPSYTQVMEDPTLL